MIAMAGLLLTLSIVGNVFQLYLYTKKPKPRKQVGPAPERKGLLGEKHILEGIYSGDTRDNGRKWFFHCSCGANYTNKNCTNEAKALDLWKGHADLFKELDPDSENARLKKELAELKDNCICKDL